MNANASLSSLWPTPAARDHKGANGPEHLENGTGRLHLDQLPNFVEHLWTAPSASDGERGGTITEAMPGTSLTQQVNSLWPTPTAMNRPRSPKTMEKCAAFRKRNANQNTVPLYLEEVAIMSASSLPDQATLPHGEESSHVRRTLNPLFVEWLMGWPPAWTSQALTPPASNACACSETGFTLWKQRMRSALSQLASPQAAPPAQLALFG
jgi:hypothetical protein